MNHSSINNISQSGITPADSIYTQGFDVVPIYIAMMIIAGISNLGTISSFIIEPRIRAKPSNYILLSLACADFGIAILTMPRIITVKTLGYWPFGETGCRFMSIMVDFTLLNVGVYSVILLSWDRYKMLMLEYPDYLQKHNKRYILKAILVIWSLASLRGIIENITWNSVLAYSKFPLDFNYICGAPSYTTFQGAIAVILVEFIPVISVGIFGVLIVRHLKKRLQKWQRVVPGRQNRSSGMLASTFDVTNTTNFKKPTTSTLYDATYCASNDLAYITPGGHNMQHCSSQNFYLDISSVEPRLVDSSSLNPGEDVILQRRESVSLPRHAKSVSLPIAKHPETVNFLKHAKSACLVPHAKSERLPRPFVSVTTASPDKSSVNLARSQALSKSTSPQVPLHLPNSHGKPRYIKNDGLVHFRNKYVKPITTYVLLVLCLLICNTPVYIYNLTLITCAKCRSQNSGLILNYLSCLIYFNSCLNPILYSMTNGQIRQFYHMRLKAFRKLCHI